MRRVVSTGGGDGDLSGAGREPGFGDAVSVAGGVGVSAAVAVAALVISKRPSGRSVRVVVVMGCGG